MTIFDLIVFVVVAVAATGGFLRGFVQEVLSLAAWALAIFAIYTLHTPVYQFIVGFVHNEPSSAVLAFSLLLLIPYAAMKLIASMVGDKARSSLLGPIDRVLGFGFGAIKGVLVVTCGFALVVLGNEASWGVAGRPNWVTQARTYPLINAGASAMVQMIHDREVERRRESARLIRERR